MLLLGGFGTLWVGFRKEVIFDEHGKIHVYLNSVQQMVSGGLAGEGLQTGFSRHGLPPQRAPLDTVYPLREHLNSVQRMVSGGYCEGLFPDTVVKKHMAKYCDTPVLETLLPLQKPLIPNPNTPRTDLSMHSCTSPCLRGRSSTGLGGLVQLRRGGAIYENQGFQSRGFAISLVFRIIYHLRWAKSPIANR